MLQRNFFLVSGLFYTAMLAAAERNLQVVQSNDRQVTIAYRLADFKLDTMQINGASGVRPDFENAIPLHTPGAPQLPTHVFVVGVPLGAKAEVAVIPGASEELNEIFVAPVPVQERADDLTKLRYAPNPQIYEREAYYPPDLVRVDPPAQFRQQTIVRVQVMPVQYNPVKKLLRIYRELQIVVRFVGGSSSLPTPAFSTTLATSSSAAEEEFYQNMLVNYEQARGFRASQPTRLQRSTNPQIEGPLYKFALRQEGIYKLDGATLRRAGISLAEVNPNTIHLSNNGGRELPRNINAPRPQGMVENAIYVSDGGDSRFDDNDFILFYGRGVEGFAFDSTSGVANHYLNHFGYDNIHWLSFGGNAGKRMAERTPLPTSGLTPATNFKDYLFVEEELNPLFESDQTWFGWLFTSTEAAQMRRYRVKLIDPIADSRANMRFAFCAPYGGGTNQLTVTFGQQELTTWEIFGSTRPQIYNVEKAGGLINGDNEIALTFRGSGDASQLYIDYFELNYERQLRLSDNMLIFNGRTDAGPFAYTLSNADANSLWLLDVSAFSNVTRLPNQNWQVNSTQVTFADMGSVKQALWIAATCTFGQFDLLERQSFGEELVLARGRGAIAGLFTARLVYATANAALNQQYYRFLYESNQQISARLGTALVLARIQTGYVENDEKFHVLGDPSLRLAIPPYSANITSLIPDTIKALTVMTAAGKVQRNGGDWPDFNGTIRFEALDSRREVTYQSPGGFSMKYSLPGNSLFRGEAPVKNGNFTVQFFVPKDITYGGQTGRLNLYFSNNTFDGVGLHTRRGDLSARRACRRPAHGGDQSLG